MYVRAPAIETPQAPTSVHPSTRPLSPTTRARHSGRTQLQEVNMPNPSHENRTRAERESAKRPVEPIRHPKARAEGKATVYSPNPLHRKK